MNPLFLVFIFVLVVLTVCATLVFTHLKSRKKEPKAPRKGLWKENVVGSSVPLGRSSAPTSPGGSPLTDQPTQTRKLPPPALRVVNSKPQPYSSSPPEPDSDPNSALVAMVVLNDLTTPQHKSTALTETPYVHPEPALNTHHMDSTHDTSHSESSSGGLFSDLFSDVGGEDPGGDF